MVKRASKKKAKKTSTKKIVKKSIKKAAPKKTVKKKISAKKITKKKAPLAEKTASKSNLKSGDRATRQAYLKIYQNLQSQVEKTWKQIQSNIKKKAKPEIIEKDKKHLLLLLGECNYMANECKKMIGREKKK